MKSSVNLECPFISEIVMLKFLQVRLLPQLSTVCSFIYIEIEQVVTIDLFTNDLNGNPGTAAMNVFQFGNSWYSFSIFTFTILYHLTMWGYFWNWNFFTLLIDTEANSWQIWAFICGTSCYVDWEEGTGNMNIHAAASPLLQSQRWPPLDALLTFQHICSLKNCFLIF